MSGFEPVVECDECGDPDEGSVGFGEHVKGRLFGWWKAGGVTGGVEFVAVSDEGSAVLEVGASHDLLARF